MKQELITYLRMIKHVSEDVKWDNDLVFSVGMKMFAVLPTTDSSDYMISFKCSEVDFQMLTQMDGITPAAYLGRYNWLSVSAQSPLTTDVIKNLIDKSYQLVFLKLAKKIQKELN